MNPDWSIVWEIVKILVAVFVGAWTNRLLESRARLISYLSSIAQHKIDENRLVTWSVVIKNAGRKAANNVRVKHETQLPHFDIQPPRPFGREQISDGGEDIIFDKVVPGEEILISYLRLIPGDSPDPAVINRGISCDEGGPKVLTYIPMRWYPVWAQRLMGALMLLGCVAAVYTVWEVIVWLVKLFGVVEATG